MSSEATFRFNFGDQDAAHLSAPTDSHDSAAPGREESPSLEVSVETTSSFAGSLPYDPPSSLS